jgi:hypothetical protein
MTATTIITEVRHFDKWILVKMRPSTANRDNDNGNAAGRGTG